MFKLNRKKRFIIKRYTMTYMKIVLGTALMAIGIAQFLLPNQLSSGGFSGIATIGYYLFNIPIGFIVLALNIPIFLVSFFKVGKVFFIKSLIGTILLSMFLNIFEMFPALTGDRFLGCIFGGIFVGIGTALNLLAKSSTGGSDLLSYIIRIYKPHLRTSSLIVIIDILIVGLNVLFFKEIEIGLYSAITIYIMGKMIDIVFEGTNFSKMVYIISKDYQRISNKINKEVKRGTTGLYGKGMYKDDELTVLMCVAGRNEVVKIIQIVKKIDKRAFVIVSNVREVIGNGFKNVVWNLNMYRVPDIGEYVWNFVMK